MSLESLDDSYVKESIQPPDIPSLNGAKDMTDSIQQLRSDLFDESRQGETHPVDASNSNPYEQDEDSSKNENRTNDPSILASRSTHRSSRDGRGSDSHRSHREPRDDEHYESRRSRRDKGSSAEPRRSHRDEEHRSESRHDRRESHDKERRRSRDYESRDRHRERNRERGSDRDGERERERERRGERRDRERERERSRPRTREREREGERPRHSSRTRAREEESARNNEDRESRRGRRESPSRSSLRARSRSITPLHKKVRKLQNWDVRPIGYDGMTAEEVKATGHFPLPGQITALKLAGALGVQGSPSHGFPAPFVQAAHCASGPAAQNMAIIRQTRRLYVGNIPYAITEGEIAEFFNNAMIQLKLSGGQKNPVVSVSINHDKNYAFVEFSAAEEATAAMAFDGVSFRNQSLKIRRPKDYQPPPGGELAPPPIHVPGVVSSNVQDTPHKIFIGGIPPYFSEDQVMELLKAFGELRSFNLVKDLTTGVSKGFAFCEYLDPNVTDVACQGLNAMEVGDKKIVMQRASVGSLKGNPIPSNYSLALPTSMSFFNAGATTLEVSNVLLLLNMVTPDELDNDEEYEDIMLDIKEECEKFGQVIDVRIPRLKEGVDVSHVGKIFVMFGSQEQSSAALRSLAGRKFADRTVLGSYFPEAKFLAGELV